MGRPIAGVVFVLVVAACGGDVAVTTTTAPPAITSTSTTTTTMVPVEVEIPETGILKFRPDITYQASRFWVPASFTANEDGWWWARGASDEWIHIEYHEDGGSAWDLDISIVAHAPNSPIEAAVEAIIRLLGEGPRAAEPSDPIAVLAEPSEAMLGVFEATVMDVFVPGAIDPGAETRFPGHSRYGAVFPGVMLLEAENPGSLDTTVRQWAFGVRLGRAARIWVVDVDGSTITIIAATRNQELFDELIPVAEELIARIEFHP